MIVVNDLIGGEQTYLISTFSSLGFLLNGIFHHIRSICMKDSDAGLYQWFSYYNEKIKNCFYRVLLDHYCNLAVLQNLNERLNIVVSYLRMRMLTGKINRSIIMSLKDSSNGEGRNIKDDELF